MIQVGDLVEEPRADEGEHGDDDQRQEVIEERLDLARGQADALGEDAGHHHADHAADAVAGEDVERVVEGRAGLPVGGQVADDAGDHADDDRLADRDIAGGRA